MTTRQVAMLAVVPLVFACSEGPTDPSSAASFDVAYSQAGGQERQTGHWEIVTPPLYPTMLTGKYSASAVRQSDGSVAGSFEVHEIYADHTDRIHGVTTCLTVQADGSARVGGIVTHSTYPNQAYVGGAAVWLVKDNGQGRNSPPDMATDIRYGYSANVAQLWCDGANVPQMGMNPVVRGNIQVTGP
ncbi:MAG TPA: hypothetical protein VF039_05890 [Longimicrobiales bacterium]